MSTDWAPITEHREDVVSVTAAQGLFDLLDSSGEPPTDGAELPLLWHWLAFLPQAAQRDLGPDGHPRGGRLLPLTGDRQRMYAGGSVSAAGTLRVGVPLTRTSKVTDVTTKTGRSGALLFVTLDHLIRGDVGLISERTSLVYKQPAPAGPSDPAGETPSDDTVWHWQRTVNPDPSMLFRFSALTYNSHRIHYDRDYATGVERYPGLVVHGPLQAILLVDALGRAFPDRRFDSFTFRSGAPAFDDAPLSLRVRSAATGEVHLAVVSAGRTTMTATAIQQS